MEVGWKVGIIDKGARSFCPRGKRGCQRENGEGSITCRRATICSLWVSVGIVIIKYIAIGFSKLNTRISRELIEWWASQSSL
jgi:hypothetical protein